MRVIAGCARRIQLRVCPNSQARPFLESARGALFNSLGNFVNGAGVLDLYAGSGALGIEALSRGADSCIFIEQEYGAVEILKENLARCRLMDDAKVIAGDVLTEIRYLAGSFDLIFIDPPFAQGEVWNESAEAVGIMHESARLLAAGGRIIFRVAEKTDAPARWENLEMLKNRIYGRSRVCVYGQESPAATCPERVESNA